MSLKGSLDDIEHLQILDENGNKFPCRISKIVLTIDSNKLVSDLDMHLYVHKDFGNEVELDLNNISTKIEEV